MDDENLINWNLKGAKKMKKRKELNALIKDKNKLKSNSMIEFFKKSSSSEKEDSYYFTGNKFIIKNKKRKHYVKVCQITCSILLISVFLITNLTLIIFNMRYRKEINTLQDEQIKHNDQLNLILTSLKDLQDNQVQNLIESDDKINLSQVKENLKNLDSFLDEQSKLKEQLTRFNQTIERIRFDLLDVDNNNDSSVADLLEIKELVLNLTSKSFENSFKGKIITEIKNDIIKPILDRLDYCDCFLKPTGDD